MTATDSAVAAGPGDPVRSQPSNEDGAVTTIHRLRPRRFLRLAVGAVFLLTSVGCASVPSALPSSTILASAAPSMPSATPKPTDRPAPTPLVTPSDGPPPSASADPTVVPTATLTPAEAALASVVRSDAGVRCAPRRTSLPPHATAGIECRPRDPLVAAVGIYAFAAGSGGDPALAAYLDRLASEGVVPRSGRCAAGHPGDSAWPAALPDTGDDGTGYRSTRSGCFINANGLANVRLTCYGEFYVGVLGRTRELAALYAWSWRVADGEDPDRDPPGLCAAPD